jgi:hypothetical protein
MSAAPSDPSADLAAADVARQRLTGALRLPSWFHTSLAAAIAAQVGTAAYGIADHGDRGLWVLAAGAAAFLAVAAVQARRFRRLNGVRVDGLLSRAVLGTSTWSSLVYGAALAGAGWAAFDGPPWLVVLASVSGGTAYAVCAQLWWQAYQRDPVAHARAESRAALVGLGAVAVVALAFLVALR